MTQSLESGCMKDPQKILEVFLFADKTLEPRNRNGGSISLTRAVFILEDSESIDPRPKLTRTVKTVFSRETIKISVNVVYYTVK